MVGIGVNLQAVGRTRPTIADRATSIEVELGRPVDRARLLVEILASIARRHRTAVGGRPRVDLRRVAAVRRAGLGGAIADWTDHDGRGGAAPLGTSTTMAR